MDAFFAAVEALFNPAYRGRSLIIGGDPHRRGVVCTASYEARRHNVRAGMSLEEAKRRCPDGLFIEGTPRKYVYVSTVILEMLKGFSPAVEPFSIDEAFIELPGAGGVNGPFRAAQKIKATIGSRFPLTCSVGIGPNKLIAKMASGLAKPDGITEMDERAFRATFWPRPADALWSVGEKTADRLGALGIYTIGQIARSDPRDLSAAFGVVGEKMHAMAWGEDDTPIIPFTDPEPAKSLGQEITLEQDCDNPKQIERVLLALSVEVGRRVRQEGYHGPTVVLKLRTDDFKTITRHRTLSRAVDDEMTIFHTARRLFHENHDGYHVRNDVRNNFRKKVRLVGVTLAGLTPRNAVHQQPMFAKDRMCEEMTRASDRLKDRFGDEILRRAATMDEVSMDGTSLEDISMDGMSLGDMSTSGVQGLIPA